MNLWDSYVLYTEFSGLMSNVFFTCYFIIMPSCPHACKPNITCSLVTIALAFGHSIVIDYLGRFCDEQISLLLAGVKDNGYWDQTQFFSWDMRSECTMPPDNQVLKGLLQGVCSYTGSRPRPADRVPVSYAFYGSDADRASRVWVYPVLPVPTSSFGHPDMY